jgi:hypothetical protein
MKTDDLGHESVPDKSAKSVLYRPIRSYFTGVAIGAGLCLGMGPPLPLLHFADNVAIAQEQGADTPRPWQWQAWRDGLLDKGVAAASFAAERESVTLFQRRWHVLLATLRDLHPPHFAGR